MTRRGALLLSGILLAACVAPPPPVSLPSVAVTAAPNTTTAALRAAAAAFSAPGKLQGRPSLAALAVAQLEYLAVELPSGRVSGDIGMIAPMLQAARSEVRTWLGIDEAVPPQQVIDAMAAAAAAPGGEPAAPGQIPAGLSSAGAVEMWRRLGAMPRLPQANAATRMALRYWEFGPLEDFDIGFLRR
ncbi:hypothetical protein BKE38_18145 [Pseudoroseomonas deserti]|uniref:Uncharacterized protein n=1 Tax=Teichococcus deserti TaxID=1817963 RepID=A0A1V2GZ28_9PROT|nr:hypothetical protein [Pseudoroseomonas deserti]ONG50444.1 hypothetical protein BKE38_18145 [Pseudoroseomonas deserti]